MKSDLKAIGSRLGQYLETKRIGTNQLGRMIGSSGALVSNILHGKNFGISKLLAIGKACQDLNQCWLLTGQGEMILDDKVDASKSVVQDKKQSGEGLENEFLRDKLKLKISSLEAAVTYRDMTIEAYKNSLSTVLTSNRDLKEMLDYHKEISKHHVETIKLLTAEKNSA